MSIIKNGLSSITLKPPAKFPKGDFCRSLFLAGSIEMGKAENWQERVQKDLANEPIFIFNPRRDDWDSSWKQDISESKFYEQVNWELYGLEISHVIGMYFDPNTKSPITLLELGLYARNSKLVVYCPKEFYRRGNVEIVCQRYGVPLYDNYDNWLLKIKEKLELI